MKILLFGINYSPELTGVGKYSGEMGDWFVAQGHNLKVITAPPYYPQWKIYSGFNNKTYTKVKDKNLEILRCPLYIPTNVTTFTRLLHLISFSISSFFPVLLMSKWKPDIIIQVAPSLLSSIQTILLSRISKSKSILHIQDFEVDAMFGLALAKGGLIKKIAHLVELKLYKKYNYITTISEGMMARCINKGVPRKNLLLFPNWAELFDCNKTHCKLKILKSKKYKCKNIILYSGNIGKKQGLEYVIKAAKEMEQHSNVHFLIVGEGAAKADIVKLASYLNLSNITFFPLFSYNDLPKLLLSVDCHLVVQKSGTADMVMPSKLLNILAVGGNAVVTAAKETTLGKLCINNPGIAKLVKPDSVNELIKGINDALNMPKPNRIAELYAKKYYNKDQILNDFFNAININSKHVDNQFN